MNSSELRFAGLQFATEVARISKETDARALVAHAKIYADFLAGQSSDGPQPPELPEHSIDL
jgi:hypothetical protein